MKSVNDLTENKDYIRNAKRKQQLEYEKEILQRHNTFLKHPVLLVNTVITKKPKSDMKEQHEVPSARSILIDEASTRTESLRDAKREVSQLEKEVIQNRKCAHSTCTDTTQYYPFFDDMRGGMDMSCNLLSSIDNIDSTHLPHSSINSSEASASIFSDTIEYPFPPETPFFNSKKNKVIIVENFDVFNKRVVPVLFRKDLPTTPLTKEDIDILWKELINGEYESPDGLDGNSYSKIKNRYDYEFRGMKNTLSRGFMDIDFMKVIEERNPKIDAIMSAKRKQQIEYEIKILDLHNKYLKGSKLMVTKTKSDMKEQQLESRKRKFICTDNHTDIDTDIIMKEAKLQAKIQEYNDLFEEELKNLENIIKELKRSEATNSEFLSEQLNYKDKYYETLDLLSYKEDENEQLIKKIKQLENLNI